MYKPARFPLDSPWQRPALLETLPSPSAGGTAAAAWPAAAALGNFAGRSGAITRVGVVKHGPILGILLGQDALQRLDQVDSLDLGRLDPAVGELPRVA